MNHVKVIAGLEGKVHQAKILFRDSNNQNFPCSLGGRYEGTFSPVSQSDTNYIYMHICAHLCAGNKFLKIHFPVGISQTTQMSELRLGTNPSTKNLAN